MPRVLLVLVVLTMMVYALVEAFQAEETRVRFMPRWLWVAAIICLPGVGALGWFFLGRPLGRGDIGGDKRRPIAPDDDPDFLRRL